MDTHDKEMLKKVAEAQAEAQQQKEAEKPEAKKKIRARDLIPADIQEARKQAAVEKRLRKAGSRNVGMIPVLDPVLDNDPSTPTPA